MYKIPEDIDESFLENSTIEMICFNTSQIYIYFSNKVQLIVEGQYLLKIGDIEQVFDVYPVTSDNRLLQLMEIKVTKVKIDDKRRNLFIEFESEWTLGALSSNSYESYTIKIGDKVVII